MQPYSKMSSNFGLKTSRRCDQTLQFLWGILTINAIAADDDHSTSDFGWKLYDLAKVNTFDQLINEPSRYVGDTTTLLDLIFTDSPHLCYHSGVSSPLANLDHCTIHYILDISTYKTKAFKCTVWDYKATNINETNESMHCAPWDTSYALYDDVGDILSFDNLVIKSICQEHTAAFQNFYR